MNDNIQKEDEVVADKRYLAEVSLEEGGIIPVSRAATTLADIMKNELQRPVIVTQNGSPIGAILNLELFRQLREFARVQLAQIHEEERK